MKTYKKILQLTILIFTNISCKEKIQNPTEKDIYIIVNEQFDGFVNQAKIWKNGVATDIIGCNNATSVTNYGNDLYIVGSSNNRATLYKNGIPNYLSEGQNATYSNSLVVKGKDVYAGGIESINNQPNAVTWKNGNITRLTDGKKRSYVHTIFVQNDDLYAAGSYDGKAAFWKNGQTTILSSLQSEAQGIFVNDKDIFIVGTEKNQAVLWKNGNLTKLTNDSDYGSANAIKIAGNDLYILGSERVKTNYILKVWKNGVASILAESNLFIDAYDFEILNNDIYIVGTGHDMSKTKRIARLWKNGIETKLSSELVKESWASSIKIN